MTQKNVEWVLGRLITDADFRESLRRRPAAALEELAAAGVELNPVERRALAAVDFSLFEEAASAVSSRLQRAGFHPKSEEGEGRPA
jgi:hypothetical protein